jgi:hypothetical protein
MDARAMTGLPWERAPLCKDCGLGMRAAVESISGMALWVCRRTPRPSVGEELVRVLMEVARTPRGAEDQARNQAQAILGHFDVAPRAIS